MKTPYTKSKPFLIFWILLSLLAPSQMVFATSERFSALVDQLFKDHKPTALNADKPFTAVLPFNSNTDLARKNVGFAISELITHKIFQKNVVRLVERDQLNSILTEQHLQQTGAIDNETAVHLGKMAGAQLGVIGSVEKIAGKYQMNARLVNVESGQILSTAFEEVPAETFEEVAAPYLHLVPKQQAIGLYIALEELFQSSKHSASFQMNGGTYTLEPKAFNVHLFGGGIRYAPTDAYFFDFSMLMPGRVADAGGVTHISTLSLESGLFIKGFITRVFSIRHNIGIHTGVGILQYKLKFGGLAYTPEAKGTSPLLRLGAEYRPQERVGLALNINLALKKVSVESPDADNAEIMNFNPLSIEPTVALYF